MTVRNEPVNVRGASCVPGSVLQRMGLRCKDKAVVVRVERENEREGSVCVCVCVCERERERERMNKSDAREVMRSEK